MLDADLATLHIRCGSDIRETLRTAGFTGDFLEYSDPICQGPVPNLPDLTETRARFLAEAYGWSKGTTEKQIAARLRDSEQRLAAAHQYRRVVLWFEHDSYDQLILARCLSRLAEGPLPARLELICIDRHPSVARFIGLGQLTPQALASLWPLRRTVTPQQLRLGTEIWAALRQPNPSDLATIAASETPALPFAAAALRRHLQELPGIHDGLSMTRRLCLRVLADAAAPVGRIYATLMQGLDPLPFLADLMFLHIVRQMALTQPGVLAIAPADRPFSGLASITEIGRELLAGRTDYLSLRPPERWLGGVKADGYWRWDDASGGIVGGVPPR